MNNRQVDLLNRLIQETEPVTGKLLAQQYLVSTKTIYNDISVINQYLKAFSSVIKKKPSMGIYIEIDEKYKEQLKKNFFSFHQKQISKMKSVNYYLHLC